MHNYSLLLKCTNIKYNLVTSRMVYYRLYHFVVRGSNVMWLRCRMGPIWDL